jgi:hypothetical protein
MAAAGLWQLLCGCDLLFGIPALLSCQQGLFKAAEEDAYGPNFDGAKPAQVTVLTFGSPNVGNQEW